MPKRPDIRTVLITGLGTGYVPIAPGTWGSAAAAGLCAVVLVASGGSAVALSLAAGAIALLASVGCVLLGLFTERRFGQKDPSQCTLDEWAGQGIALIALPVGPSLPEWTTVIAVAFFAFRLFDIVKAPPARYLEKLPHGWGIVIDDLVAGVYANVAAQLLLRLWLLN